MRNMVTGLAFAAACGVSASSPAQQVTVAGRVFSSAAFPDVVLTSSPSFRWASPPGLLPSSFQEAVTDVDPRTYVEATDFSPAFIELGFSSAAAYNDDGPDLYFYEIAAAGDGAGEAFQVALSSSGPFVSVPTLTSTGIEFEQEDSGGVERGPAEVFEGQLDLSDLGVAMGETVDRLYIVVTQPSGPDLGLVAARYVRCSPADITTTGAVIPGQLGYGVPDGRVDLDDLGYFLNTWLVGCF